MPSVGFSAIGEYDPGRLQQPSASSRSYHRKGQVSIPPSALVAGRGEGLLASMLHSCPAIHRPCPISADRKGLAGCQGTGGARKCSIREAAEMCQSESDSAVSNFRLTMISVTAGVIGCSPRPLLPCRVRPPPAYPRLACVVPISRSGARLVGGCIAAQEMLLVSSGTE